jgi:hypothetical protein
MSSRTTELLRMIICASIVCAAVRANAQLSPIASPFAGTTETFESFANAAPTSPFSILGGIGSLSDANPFIWSDTGISWGLGTSGIAVAADGSQGFGVNHLAETATIAFTKPMTEFGGFWGVGTGLGLPAPNTETVTFFDAGGAQIGSAQTFSYDHAVDTGLPLGGLDWHGWFSSTPVASVQFKGDFTALDSVRVIATTPEPAAPALLLSAFAAPAVCLVRRRFARRTL